MISAVIGAIAAVHEPTATVDLQMGPVTCELLVPAADLPALLELIGQDVTFFTLMYLEGDPNRGNLEPRLLGFLRRQDKRFFELFTTVKGIGPRKALRALAVPVGQIAQAIESKDTRALVALPEIGKRTAEQIVAELSGKARPFLLTDGQPQQPLPSRLSPVEEDAVAALMQLGERRADAELLLDRARQSNGELKTTDALLREMLRLRGGR